LYRPRARPFSGGTGFCRRPDLQSEEVKTPWIESWHCVYDLKTGDFSVPPDFAENNAKAIKYPEPK
jgi:hypothetical protein